MSAGASFTYLGVSFNTPNGSHGFVAANDGSAYEYMVPNRVIIAGGTEQERNGFWLEFSPDDAIALAHGIVDAAGHAMDGAVNAGSSAPVDLLAHIPPPAAAMEVGSWQEDADGNWRRFFVAKEWVLVTESSRDCPDCREVFVSIVGLQDSSGHFSTGISVDADSELNATEAGELAGVLIDAADALESLDRGSVGSGGAIA
ncbi:hypothetical protein [Mycobacterium intracellulare]|uniref:hypothetical protein n=1 Tax=Mycobacterium intracellulare TaxID=1767 RepID=UPI00080BBB19|nr:hypothetical protein [Mycobacterium intracellulare]OCB15429.1 hypothetical protein A5689_26630 [Mycobacterium intracellulare subsp. yongonense]